MSEQSNTTSFDNLIQNNQLRILKAALPYIQLSEQRLLSVYVKILELKNTMELFNKDEGTLSACSLQKENASILDLLQDIRKYCPPDKQDAIDQILNFANMYQMYQTYQTLSKDFEREKKENPDLDTMEQIKSMMSPEQQSIFETYLSGM